MALLLVPHDFVCYSCICSTECVLYTVFQPNEPIKTEHFWCPSIDMTLKITIHNSSFTLYIIGISKKLITDTHA